MMHHSTTFPRLQSADWTKATMHSKQNILCYVGTGWFSLAWWRARDWPFWSHSIFLCERVWRGVHMSPVAYNLRIPGILARPCSAFSQLSDVA